MKRKILPTLILLSFLVVAFSSFPVQATNGDLIQLGLCIDGSGSIYSSDFTVMINGIGAAIRNNLPHDGTVELCVIQFADNGPAVVEIAPTIIDSDATAETVATAVEGITQLLEFTSMADGVWLTWDVMKGSPNFVAEGKQIINLATDGLPNEWLSLAPGTTGNSYDDVVLVVGWAVAEGLDELDAEAITSGADVAWLRDYVVYPQPGYQTPPFAGPGWVRYVDTFEEFADTIGEKFDIIVPQEKDVEAVSQTVTDNEVEPGDLVDIDVTVHNNGDYTETFDLTCYYDSVEIGTILVVNLAPGETRVATFTWDTTGVSEDSYSITAWADSDEIITEVDEANNYCTMPLEITIAEEPIEEDVHDVEAVSQTVTDNEVDPGDLVDISVTMHNNGDFTETFDLTCYYDSVEIGKLRVIDLAPGESRLVIFTWDTDGVPLNEYDIKAWADSSNEIVEVDEDNNWCTMRLKLFVIPEVPLGTIVAALSMFIALIGYVGFKRYRTK